MASEKISDMPVATDFGATDVLPVVQGGVNKQVTRETLLVAKAGELIRVANHGLTASVTIDDDTIILAAGTVSMQFVVTGNRLKVDGLPTSDPHVAGALWTNTGVLTRSAG